MVIRTERLDEDTKKQVFLACNWIFKTNEIRAEEFTGVDRIFTEAIIKKDYAAWKMAAEYAVLYNKLRRIRFFQ